MRWTTAACTHCLIDCFGIVGGEIGRFGSERDRQRRSAADEACQLCGALRTWRPRQCAREESTRMRGLRRLGPGAQAYGNPPSIASTRRTLTSRQRKRCEDLFTRWLSCPPKTEWTRFLSTRSARSSPGLRQSLLKFCVRLSVHLQSTNHKTKTREHSAFAASISPPDCVWVTCAIFKSKPL